MNRRTLYAILGVVSLGGILYRVVSVPASTDVSDCQPAHIQAEVALDRECRLGADGGFIRPRVVTLEMVADVCESGNKTAMVIRNPLVSDGGYCASPTSDRAITLLEPVGTCTNATLCAAGARGFAVRNDKCACRAIAKGLCRYSALPDGGGTISGVLPGQSVPMPFVGAGCVNMPCTELAGEQGSSWPPECDQ